MPDLNDLRSVGSIPTARVVPPIERDAFTLCGWAALFDGLRLINDRGPIRPLPERATSALVEYVGHRRDELLHHFYPQFAA